ncbi:hypothetical protein EZS27_027398, partial [termite gut metagenome]
LLFTLLGITACDEKEDPVISIDDSSKEITFSAAAGEKIITVKGVTAFEVTDSGNDTWYQYPKKVEGNKFTVSVDANLTPNERKVSLTISSGKSEPVSFSITQDGSIFDVSPNDKVLNFEGRGNSLIIYVTNTAEVAYSVEIPGDDDWLSSNISPVDWSLTLTAAPSNILSRESIVNLILGDKVIPLTITQSINIAGDYILSYYNNYYYPDVETDDNGNPLYIEYLRKVTLQVGKENGTYVIKENLPEKVDSLVFTYKNEVLSIVSGQMVGQRDVYSPRTGNTTHYNLIVQMADTGNESIHQSEDPLSYDAPLTIDNGVICFIFEATAYERWSYDAIAITGGGALHTLKDIKLIADIGEDIDEIKEPEPEPALVENTSDDNPGKQPR